jgi:Cu+-exporting ATPase
VLEALEVGEGTLQAQIERMLSAALAVRMPLEALVDRVSAAFVLFTVALAAGVGVYYWHLGRTAEGMLDGLAVLVVACPCALGLATPLAGFVALQRAAREGILFRSAEVLEKLARVDTIVLDKTGTLTEGRFRVGELRSSSDVPPDELLRIAASLESSSEHHLGRAIVEAAQARGLPLAAVDNFVNHPGEGIEGDVSPAEMPGAATRVLLGSLAYLCARGFEVPQEMAAAAKQADFGTEVYLGWEGRVRGAMRLEDHIREDARAAVVQCRQAGLEVHLLSGDRRASAERVAAALDIAHWVGERLPAQKVAYVAELQKAGRRVAMAGDGVNDAPALAQADAGFTHQVGTDMSREAADVHVLGTSLARIPWSIAFSRRAFRHIRQNLFWAFFYNVVAMGMAAAGWLRPVMAAAAMIASSLMVVGNSLRLGKAPGISGGARTAALESRAARASSVGPPPPAVPPSPADSGATAFSRPGRPPADRASTA